MALSGYDYVAFMAEVARMPWSTGCFVCDVVLPTRYAPAVASERRQCAQRSGDLWDAHHCAVPKQVLKREFPAGVAFVGGLRESPDDESLAPFSRRRLDDLLMDPRNGVMVRRYHHNQLEARQVVVPKEVLPGEMMDFVRELGLEWYVDKMQRRS